MVGATAGTTGHDHGLDLRRLTAPVLVPGLGAQGATPADVARAFGDAGGPVVPVSAREVLASGPDGGALRAACDAVNGALRAGGPPVRPALG